jgi:hypothetical protein
MVFVVKQTRNRSGLAALVIVLLFLNVGQFVYFEILRGPTVPAEDSPLQVTDITGDNRPNYLGKVVTLDGYFAGVAPGVSLLVSSIDDFGQNKLIPLTSFVTIGGSFSGLTLNDTGSRILLKGTVGVDDSNSSITRISYMSHRVLEKSVRNYAQYDAAISVVLPAIFRSNKYAVLISGGYDEVHAYLRYWVDLKFMYAILVNVYDYNPSNIFVIYKDGVGEDSYIPVNYSCTVNNLNAAFSSLAEKMTIRDQLFIFATNHGSLDGLALWHQEVSPSAFASMLGGISYDRMIIVMGQCFSGEFIPYLSGPNRVILTAASATESSYACPTEGPWDEFLYQFMVAVYQFAFHNPPIPIVSDFNGDGKVSMVEAFNYAWIHDIANEHPQFDDNADGISQSTVLPYGGDGTHSGVGATTYL